MRLILVNSENILKWSVMFASSCTEVKSPGFDASMLPVQARPGRTRKDRDDRNGGRSTPAAQLGPVASINASFPSPFPRIGRFVHDNFPTPSPQKTPPSSPAPPRPPLPSPHANPAAPSSPSPGCRVAGADGAPVAPAGGGHGIPLRRGCGPAVRDATNRYARKDVSFLLSM